MNSSKKIPIFVFVFFSAGIGTYAQTSFLKQLAYPDLTVVDIADKKEQKLLALPEQDGSGIVLWDKKIVFNFGQYAQGAKQVFDHSSIQLSSDGYRSFLGPNKNTYRVVEGAGFFLVSYHSALQLQKDRSVERVGHHGDLRYPYFGYVDDGIKSISAWSALVEKTTAGKVVYGAENLRYPAFVVIEDSVWVSLNQTTVPWAEGGAGAGVGGTLTVEFARPSAQVAVLNGYVDLSKPSLYKANNRLKVVRIESEYPQFNIEYTFEDVVKFHEVLLPKATTKIKVTIVDVYKGSKYDDTCVTKIFLPQKELRSKEEYQAKIENALKKSGYLQ